MPIFAALGNSTDEGIRHLENLSARHRSAVKRVEQAGGKLLGSYALLGHYDYLVLLEFPDERSALRFMAQEGSRGHIRYVTMPAVPTEEFAKLVEG
ncbi:MAG: GYD domain-containing protein [Chloroflexi bacterium]|nr:GYD domain-containing protein [Chloroflexota bacterium]